MDCLIKDLDNFQDTPRGEVACPFYVSLRGSAIAIAPARPCEAWACLCQKVHFFKNRKSTGHGLDEHGQRVVAKTTETVYR